MKMRKSLDFLFVLWPDTEVARAQVESNFPIIVYHTFTVKSIEFENFFQIFFSVVKQYSSSVVLCESDCQILSRMEPLSNFEMSCKPATNSISATSAARAAANFKTQQLQNLILFFKFYLYIITRLRKNLNYFFKFPTQKKNAKNFIQNLILKVKFYSRSNFYITHTLKIF